MSIPSNSILWQLENESYEKNPKKNVDKWLLLNPYSDGIKCYLQNNIIVCAIRGTADLKDIQADLRIANGSLYKSKIYLEDKRTLLDIQAQYPKEQYYYFGVAHSLGGAILDQFLHEGLLIKGVSYNPAVELKYINNNNNHRIYNEYDPLYKIFGKIASNVEVRKNNSIFKKVLNLTPYANIALSLKSHLLSNFKGGFLY